MSRVWAFSLPYPSLHHQSSLYTCMVEGSLENTQVTALAADASPNNCKPRLVGDSEQRQSSTLFLSVVDCRGKCGFIKNVYMSNCKIYPDNGNISLKILLGKEEKKGICIHSYQ